MEEFIQLFGNLLAFVYHCFDRIMIHGYLSGLSRPEQVVYFVRQVLGLPGVSKEVLSQRTRDYQDWVEAYARNHHLPIAWAEKGVRKEDYVSPRLRRLVKKNAYGVYFIFKSMEQGRTFRISVPKYPTPDPNYREYMQKVRQRIHSMWSYPREARNRDLQGRLVIEFHIGKDGQLLSLELLQSSGEHVLDISALNAVKLADRYPPLPDAMRRDVLPVVAIFTYRIRTTQSSTFQLLQ